MALFLGRYDLNNGRNVRNRLGLGIGNMPLLNDEAGAVLAHLGAVRGHVHGMTAAVDGDIPGSGESSDDSPNHVLDPIPPAGRCLLLGLFYVLFIDVHGLLFSKVFEKLHGGGVVNDELRVITGSEHPPPALRIDGLHGQHHGKNVFATIIRNIIRHSNT